MKPKLRLNAITVALASIAAGTASQAQQQQPQWYYKDAYFTPDSTQRIGSAPSPRVRWVAPPPGPVVAPPPAVSPAPAPAPVDLGGPPDTGYQPDQPDIGAGGGAGGQCFLTTATVHAMGKADDGEELTAARFLRDHKMTDGKGRSATELYYLVGPKIVERKTDWADFYVSTVQPLTVMVKAGHHDLAIKRYSLETAKLVDQHATRYEDKELVQAVYDYAFGKGSFESSLLPYPAKYAKLKAALKVGIVAGEDKLSRQEAALGYSLQVG
jgi:hypothetical protein